MSLRVAACALALAVPSFPVLAEDKPVNITRDVASVRLGSLEISRNPDPEAQLEGDWAKTSRACPPFCIQPMSPAEGVRTIGELELLEMLQDPAVTVVDSRTPDWFQAGSIPGSINLPYTEMTDHLGELGCEIDFDGWDCAGAQPVALFCNGPWCGQSPAAIRRMIEAGFPPEKIAYYRGGMQVWRMLGLTVTE